MEIKVEINEARIIKSVMDGKTQKEIEDSITMEIKEKIKQRILDDISWKGVVSKISSKINNDDRKKIIDYCHEQVKSRLTPQNIRTLLKKEELDNMLGGVFAEYIEHALSEWLCLEFNVSVNNGKKKAVAVCGKDSWTFLRK